MADAFDEQVQPVRRERETAARELLVDYIDAADEPTARFVFAALQRSYAYLDEVSGHAGVAPAGQAGNGAFCDSRVVRRLVALSLLGAVAAMASFAAPAQAATCDEYSTQAEAQLAADTRDADGDGRYCEELPCPCLGPDGGG